MENTWKKDVRKLIVLECIKQTGPAPYPASEDWGYLDEDVQGLEQEGLLSIDSETYVLSREGKKLLFLFDDQRKELIKGLEPFKAVRLGGESRDLRLPVFSFVTKGLPDKEGAKCTLNSVAFCIYWQELFDRIKFLADLEGICWQRLVADDLLFYHIDEDTSCNDWKSIDSDKAEAARLVLLLLKPAKLSKITRNINA